jgi:site-specific DNA recombinase
MLRQATYTTPVTALYARLSKDDEQQGPSLSIENQKRILETFARDNGFLNCRFFVDDGWSGANFQRPGFMEMMDCVESGEVKCVITKDLSRMGRNYLQVGMFTEITFPKKGVRFIAINDGVDSAQGENDLTPLKNLFNEWMVRDTSKKIKAVKRAKGMSGKPTTTQPVYGYLMGEDERFIVDEEAAPVVKQIYDLCLAGNGPSKIARVLTEQGVPTPGTLEYRRTGSTRRYHPGYECKWATNTIVHILERKEYLGHLVNFKTEKVSYKVKSSVENPEEKQVIFENAHEPIIDPDTWERVQELRKQRKRPNRYDEVGLFSGLLFCADCGSVLYQQRYENKTRKQDCYICGNYKKRTHDCTAHFIRTDLLTAGVTANLKKITAYAAKHEKQFMKLLVQQNEDGGKRRNAAKKRELEAAEKRIGELSAIFKRLYEDSVAGRITDERFAELSADYEAEQRQVREHAAELQAELSKAQEASVNAERFMNIVRRHISFEELTPTLLREFIEKIVVHECSYDENKHRRQEIEIYYSFVGKVDLPDE